MRTKNLLKLAFTMLAMIVMTGAMAQVSNSDYSQNATDDASGITMQTENTTVGLYAEPDASYNPNYVAPAWTLNPNAVWTWTLGTLTTTGNSGTPANYVELNGAAAGNYSINVVESNTLLPGTCVDAGTDHTIVFLPEPTMVVGDGANAFGAICGPLNGHEVTFNIEAATLANDALSIQWRLTEYEVTINGATGDYEVSATPAVATVEYLWDKFTATTAINGNDWTVTDDGSFNADGSTAPALSALELSMSRDYTNTGSEIAYLYRWEIATADGDGVSDRISRKSQYIDGGTGVYGTNGTIDIYIVNAPETGPIFHIPNSYGN
jgi:hypothetical protein